MLAEVPESDSVAARNMQVAARKDPARSDLPQYSEKALFEALVNAVVHRDYSMRGSKIRLSMFDDRLEIQSPGSLPNNLTVQSMASRQSTRNEALTSVLARMPVGGTRGALPEGGSVIISEATGHLPGLKGRLNPIRDTHDRTCLYASNISIDEGKQQPVHFIPGEELQLTDAEGTGLRVRIVDIVGRSALVEYFDARRGSR